MPIEYYTGMAEIPSFTPPAAVTISLWYVNLGWNVTYNRLCGNADAYEIKIDSVYHDVFNELCKTTGTNTTATIPDGVWTHIVCTADTATGAGQTFINGILDIATTGHTVAPGAGIFGIGGRYGAAAGALANGIIEDFRMYNRVLTAQEIKIIYDCDGTDNIRNNLIHEYRMKSIGGAGSVAVGAANIYDSVGKNTANIISGAGYFWGGRKKMRRAA